MSHKYINPACYEDELEFAGGSLPTEPGYYTYDAKGSMETANRMFQEFLTRASRTREGFQLLSTNVVPQFNGVIIYATYKFDRALTIAEVNERRAARR